MSAENAQLLYKAAHEAQQKFEYFLTGIIGAMFAYIVQTYTPQKLDWSASTLEPIALIFLAMSFFLGLHRINCIYHILGMSYEETVATDSCTEIRKALEQGEPHKDSLPPQQREYMEGWRKTMEVQQARAKSAASHVGALDQQSKLCYNLRNHLLIGGFVAILLARILAPYAK
jgi:hypothetical protein